MSLRPRLRVHSRGSNRHQAQARSAIIIVVGIDPGLNGSLAFVSPNAATVEDMPTKDLPGTGLIGRRVDGRALADLLRAGVPADERCIVVCEMVRAMGGKNNAIQIQGSLSRTLGAIEAVLDMLRITPHMIEPQTWKRFYRLKADKTEAIALARKLFKPLAKTHLTRVRDHNRAESLLIAQWGVRNLL